MGYLKKRRAARERAVREKVVREIEAYGREFLRGLDAEGDSGKGKLAVEMLIGQVVIVARGKWLPQ